MSLPTVCAALLLLLASCCVAGETVVAFDGAAASSTYADGTFTAGEAISKGTGYWCSAGSHAPGQTVTWTGTLAARQRVLGITLNWAYGPGQFKVLTSTDGGNVEEAACWRSAKRKEVSYKETVMFDGARNVKALTVAMRSPMPWGYFGLNDIALIVEPGPMMLISGSPSEGGERCMVSDSNSVGSEDCLQAIAAGAGREIFTWNDASQLVSMHEGKCISLASGAATGGDVLALQDCTEALEAGDGRSTFELTATGQLRFKNLGSYCIVASQASVHVQDCGAAEESTVAQDKFFPAAVVDFDPSRAVAAADAAALLQAAAARQAALAAELHEALPRLETCRLALSTNASHVHQPFMLGQTRSELATAGEGGAVVTALRQVYASLGVDMAGINRLIIDTAGALASARSKAAVAA